MSTESTNTVANESKQTTSKTVSRLNADAAVFQPTGWQNFTSAASYEIDPHVSRTTCASENKQGRGRGHSPLVGSGRGRGNVSKRKPKPTKLTVGAMMPNSSHVAKNADKEHHRGPKQKNSKKKRDGDPLLNPADFPALPSAPKTPPAPQDQILQESEHTIPTIASPPATQSLKDSKGPQHVPQKILKRGEQIPPKPMKLDSQQPAKTPGKVKSKESTNQLNNNNMEEALTGSEHDLMRLVQERNVTLQNKGRQRLRPRKKKFSTLKKKVLEERLRKWRELNPESTNSTTAASDSASDSTPKNTVCIQHFADIDAVQDEDEYEELVQNIQEMAEKIGETRRVFLSKGLECEEAPAFVEFVDDKHAQAAVNCWDGLVIGGQELKCYALNGCCSEGADTNTWQSWCMTSFSVKPNESHDPSIHMQDIITDIALLNALSEDDFEDPDCLEESIHDIRQRAREFGEIANVRIEAETSKLILSYKCSPSAAEMIVSKLSKVMLGGTLLVAAVHGTNAAEKHDEELTTIVIHDVLTDDDFEDEDCLEESLCDIKELAERFGSVMSVEIESKEASRNVLIHYKASMEVAMHAIDEFNRMNIGGGLVTATLLSSGAVKENMGIDSEKVENGTESFEPMYSGDKLIPERFAMCKRVPKVRTNEGPRQYAVTASDERAKPLLIEMLAELMRLQRRAIEEKNTKAKRRVVMGLREVARGIRSRKVKMVVMASNLDEYDIIDEKLQEIMNLAVQGEIPMFFEFTKKGLGKAVGKTIKIAAIGIQNADGAHQQFKKLVSISSEIQSLLSKSLNGNSNDEGLQTD